MASGGVDVVKNVVSSLKRKIYTVGRSEIVEQIVDLLISEGGSCGVGWFINSDLYICVTHHSGIGSNSPMSGIVKHYVSLAHWV